MFEYHSSSNVLPSPTTTDSIDFGPTHPNLLGSND